jgi:hypothetical protein
VVGGKRGAGVCPQTRAPLGYPMFYLSLQRVWPVREANWMPAHTLHGSKDKALFIENTR